MSLKLDYQPPRGSIPRRRSLRGRQIALPAFFFIVAGIALLALWGGSSPELEARETPVELEAPVVSAVPEPIRDIHKSTVPQGSSITALLGDYFSAQEILQLSRDSRDIFPFTRICAGQPYLISTVDGRFEQFVYEIDTEEQLVIRRDADATRIERVPIVYDVRTELLNGKIETSLFDAVSTLGEDSRLAFMLADIFAWDVDFILDVRRNDSFKVLVEKRFREGNFSGYGKILAAEFSNQGEVYRAVRFRDGDQKPSYYNENGENVRRAFLKAPLSFTRISSGFTMKRLHPITKTWKAHPAIDYVAPVGTPIKTVGDGSISRIGYTKANGNFIEVRHSNGYRTLYLHMKAFARGMQKGKRVTQGQVIGYLGGTGLATGPHLCFRMKKNGAPVNPTKLRAPAAESVSPENMPQFLAVASPLLARLDSERKTRVASLETATATGSVE